eukprot:1138993-Pelagomonas_calceolata.AAC.7
MHACKLACQTRSVKAASGTACPCADEPSEETKHSPLCWLSHAFSHAGYQNSRFAHQGCQLSSEELDRDAKPMPTCSARCFSRRQGGTKIGQITWFENGCVAALKAAV